MIINDPRTRQLLSKWTSQTKMSNVPLNFPQEIRTTKKSSENLPKKIQFLPCLFLGKKKSVNMFFLHVWCQIFPLPFPGAERMVYLPTFDYVNGKLIGNWLVVFPPHLKKYATLKLDSISPTFGVKIKNIFELPPPSFVWWFGIRIGIPLSNNPFHKGILGIFDLPPTRFMLENPDSHTIRVIFAYLPTWMLIFDGFHLGKYTSSVECDWIFFFRSFSSPLLAALINSWHLRCH